MTSRLLWGLLAIHAALGVASQAQVRVVRQGDDRLVGITEVDLVLRHDESAAPHCSTPKVLPAAAAVLTNAGIKATVSDAAPSWFYSVVITLTHAVENARCLTAVTTQLVTQVAGIPEADSIAPPGTWGSLLIGEMPLLREATIVAADPDARHTALQNAVRAHVAAIAARLRAANP